MAGRSTSADLALVAIFVGVLAAPLCGVLRDGVEDEIRITERRQAAPLPDIELAHRGPIAWPKTKSLKGFPAGFEAWFNDHLWLRRQQLLAYNLALHAGLVSNSFARPAAGQAARAPVIIGRDGWLFFSGDRLIEDYRCTDPFRPDELNEWQAALEERRDWLAERGIRYLVVVAPNAQTIYGEYLPQSMNRVGDKSRLDQLLERMHGTGVEVLDLRAPLLAAKSQLRTYHKTDTHWNEFGAFVACREILTSLARWNAAAVPPSLADFDVQTIDSEGDYLAKLVESPLAYREEVIRLVPRQPRKAVSEEVAPRNLVTTCDEAPLPRAVVLHDSFMQALAPFLSEHFQRAHYLWTRDFRTDVIDRERPALVIEEMVERRLMSAPPPNPESIRQPRPGRLAAAPGDDRQRQ